MVALAAIRYGLRTSAEMSRWRTGSPFFSVVRTTIWRGKLGPADTATTTGGSPLVARAARSAGVSTLAKVAEAFAAVRATPV